MSSFDDWVEEAPARHLAVFALLILATAALLTGG